MMSDSSSSFAPLRLCAFALRTIAPNPQRNDAKTQRRQEEALTQFKLSFAPLRLCVFALETHGRTLNAELGELPKE